MQTCRMLGLVGFVALCSAAAHAEIVTKTIDYKHDDVQLQGYLAYDDAVEGERPGVLVVHEWWGLNDYAKRRTRQLAELGYVAFAADMYGKGKVTADPKQAGEWAGHMSGDLDLWRSRAMRGLEILKGRAECDADRTAAIGYCFGGSTVTQMAFADAPIKGVVSFHGSLPLPPQAGELTIKPEVLICHGAEDGFVKPEQIDAFKSALDDAGAHWTFVEYSGAQHSFTNPNADDYGVNGVSYNRRADQRSWAHMKAFFERILAK